jgi:hypothetical protein
VLPPPPEHAAVAETARTVKSVLIRRAFISEFPWFVVVVDRFAATGVTRH